MSRKRKPSPAPAQAAYAPAEARAGFLDQLPPWVLALCASGLTALVYARTADFGFVNLDDPSYVSQNPHVLAGLSLEGLRWAIVGDASSYWHPLTWLSFMLDRSLFGDWAGGFHLMNAGLHCVNVALLFFLARRWFALAGVGGKWTALAVALAFGLHPVHVESVAWITERKDVLFTFFGLLCLHGYTTHAQSPARGFKTLLPCLLAYGASLASKPMLVTLPALLLVLDFWPLGRLRLGQDNDKSPAQPGLGALLLEKAGFVLLAAGATASTILTHPAGHDPLQPALSLKLANALASYLDYLRLLVWPAGLAVFYPFPQAVPAAKLGAAALVLCGVTALALREVRRRPYLLAGWLWFLGTLAPVLIPPKVGMRIAYGDRYAYFTFLGLYLALALLAWEALRALKDARTRQMAAATGLALVCAVLATLSYRQLDWWRNEHTLYERALAVTEGNYFIMRNYSVLRLRAGDARSGEKWLRAAIAARPDYGLALNGLGAVLTFQHRFAEAVPIFARALEDKSLEPAIAFEVRYGLGYNLAQLGRFDEAEAYYLQALELRPNHAQTYNDLGSIALLRGQAEVAERYYLQAVNADPGFALARDNLARLRALGAGQGRR